jgi:AcrR family transcriptional regulator
MTARDRLIASAVDLVRRDGVAGTGLAQLLEVSGTARRSLYLNFPGGKAQLIDAATAVAGETYSAAIDDLAAEGDPVSVIQFVTDWATAWPDPLRRRLPDRRRGVGPLGGTGGRRYGWVFTDWQNRLTEHLEAAQLAPQDAAELATVTIAAVEGAVVMCQATRSDEPLRHVESSLIALYRSMAARI